MLSNLDIISPKRTRSSGTAWESFFPYYAGFPEVFVSRILQTSGLPPAATIFDPWNGSGTTTYAAAKLGFSAIGFDINPVMVVVGRARLLAATEADSIEPICKKILKSSHAARHDISPNDPLLAWFGPKTARVVRSIENSICSHLVGSSTISNEGLKLENMSGLAAAFYVSLFSLCRAAGRTFRASNPTWFRYPKVGERRISISRPHFEDLFTKFVSAMAEALLHNVDHLEASKIRLADSTFTAPDPETVDLILTSPPYCTRIDYTAATRIELAILAPMMGTEATSLRRKMLGSIQVPNTSIETSCLWGSSCVDFLGALRNHSSKASSSYYLKTHLDYFQKLFHSIGLLSHCLKIGGYAIFVVQDSYYKELHNDLAQIVTEMGRSTSLLLRRRENFYSHRSMSGINGRSRAYSRPFGATETVLCFEKISGGRRQ